MTLPFRGRHHDSESAHDRARSLTSAEMLAPLTDDDATWLARHLESCAECRRDREGYLADRELLRGLRAHEPEAPRDLWARTSAAIDREAGRSRRRRTVVSSGRAATRDLWRGMPVGVAASALIVLVVVGTSILAPRVPQGPPPGSLPIAQASPVAQPTPISIPAADPVAWIRPSANGRWELVISDVDQVCPTSRQGCQDLGANDPPRQLDLGGTPTGIAISPDSDQLVVQSKAEGTEQTSVFVLPVPTPATGPTTAPATPDPATAGPPSEGSSPGPSPTPEQTPGSTPDGAIEIASGVTMVREAAYSADGAWLAFSARPADDSTGPDLYVWHVGDPAAVAVTSDHQTYFSGWLGDSILASRVEAGPSEGSGPSERPDASQEGTPATSDEVGDATPAHPSSFLLDPATLVRTELSQPDVWLPVVDPAGRFTAYWSGTLLPTDDGLGWRLADGRLVLDRWIGADGQPGESPTAPKSTDAPGAVGPAGDPVTLDLGIIGTFQARFDPEGLRLAVWTGDEPGAAVGRLHLVVLDPQTGKVDATVTPLPGVPAVRRFSIDASRLAWVSPRGQDGRESAVQVLGWVGNDFGEIHTIPAKDLFIVR